jgi:hypothetical protein
LQSELEEPAYSRQFSRRPPRLQTYGQPGEGWEGEALIPGREDTPRRKNSFISQKKVSNILLNPAKLAIQWANWSCG